MFQHSMQEKVFWQMFTKRSQQDRRSSHLNTVAHQWSSPQIPVGWEMGFKKQNFHKKGLKCVYNYLNTCMSSMYPTSLRNLLGHQLKVSKPVVNATSVKPAPASWPQSTSHSWHNPHTLAPAHTVDERGQKKVSVSSQQGFYQAENLPSF